MNINEQLSQESKEYGARSTEYFTFQRGDNRLRILTLGTVIATHFFGKGIKAHTCYGENKGCPFHGSRAPKNEKGQEKKPSIKYTCYILNKNVGVIQMGDLPYSVIKQVGEYQTDIDYSFDSFPMPYDITVKYNPDSNSPNDMYKMIASPKREEISEEIKEELVNLLAKQTPEDHVAKKKDWQMKEDDKLGLRLDVSPRKSRSEWVKEVNMEAGTQTPVEKGYDYPEEKIKPEDIPF